MLNKDLFYFAFHASQNEAQIAQAVQADEHVGVNLFGFSQTQQAALRATGGGTGDIQSGGGYGVAGDQEMA